jgi:hypothetical protein
MSTIVSSWAISGVDRGKIPDLSYNVYLLVQLITYNFSNNQSVKLLTTDLRVPLIALVAHNCKRYSLQFVWVSVHFDIPREDLSERCVRHNMAVTTPLLNEYSITFFRVFLNLLAFSNFHDVFYYFKPHVIKTASGKATLGEGLL